MIQWFGTDKFSPACDDNERVPVPVGEECGWCQELIVLGDVGVTIPHASIVGTAVVLPYHQDCFLRFTMGSIGHQIKDCECYGVEDVSEKGLTRREAARRAGSFARRRRLR